MRRALSLRTAAASAVLVAVLALPACGPEDDSGGTEPYRARAPILFRDVTGETGITFQHTDGSSGRRFIVEAMSTGIATFDYDGDGRIDLYLPNGAPLPGYRSKQPPRHALYRNLGGLRFEDVTESAGVACTAYGMGVAIADYDNDGDPDIYLNNFGPNVLYRNEGDGTFTDVTQQAGVAGEDCVGAGACFLDIEGDGDLDLYVGNYIVLDCDEHVPHRLGGHPTYPSPKEYEPVADTLYRNEGDGTFTDVSEPSLVGSVKGRSMGMACADYDNDGDTDVFVCNDVQENFLFRNDGKGRFSEQGRWAGVATGMSGALLANMAVTCADYDRDGLLDFLTTNYQGQAPLLLQNTGRGLFRDVAWSVNATAGTFLFVNWGCGLIDFDNDGHHDIYIGNGHTEDNIEERDPQGRYRCPDVVLHNLGDGTFSQVHDFLEDGDPPVEASRGTAFDDLDNDGDVDVVVLNARRRPTILQNLSQDRDPSTHWLQVRLRGTRTNRDGVGAHVTVIAGDLRLLEEVHSGHGYQSHWGSRLHYGLGKRERVERIEVRWIGGGTEVFEGGAADRLVTLVEGEGKPKGARPPR